MPDYLSLSVRRPETRILAAISGLWMSRLMGFASKVGLFEAVAPGAVRASDIARAKGFAEDPLARALDGLVHLGLIERSGDCFSLTADGCLMLPGARGGFKDMAALWHDLFDGAWAELETTMRTGEPGFAVYHGEPIFARIGRDAVAAQHFDGAMRGLSQLIAADASALIAERLCALSCASLCDVGGGDGYLISEIAALCPEIDCQLLELPHVVDAGAANLKDRRVTALSGSFFESVPAADAHILSNIVHDWPDDDAVRILRRVRAAQAGSGTLFVLEMMLGGDCEPLLARSTDLNMLVLTGGRERTRQAFEQLLAQAGYRVRSVQPIADLTCLVEAVPTANS
jgi:hypothetical protein